MAATGHAGRSASDAEVDAGAGGGDVEIIFVDIAHSAPLLEAEENATARLSPEDRSRIARMGEAAARDAWRACRIATRIVLERWVGAGIRRSDFILESGGRPRLAEPPPYFSVSHSGGGLLIAVAAHCAIGIDLEARRRLLMPADRRLKLCAASGLVADPGSGIGAAPSDEDVQRSWVRLEALAKARGSGIGRLLTDAGILGDKRGVVGQGEIDGDSGPSFAVREVAVPVGYVAAVAANSLPATLVVAPFPGDAAALSTFLEDDCRRPKPAAKGVDPATLSGHKGRLGA